MKYKALKNKNWAVLEEMPKQLPSGWECLSVAPETSFACDKLHIPYMIWEDFFSEDEVFEGEEDFFHRQIEWFDRLDLFLQDHFRYCSANSLKLGSAHYYRIKFLVDSLAITGRMVRFFLRRAEPSAVEYFAPQGRFPKSIYAEHESVRETVRQVFVIQAKDAGIPFACSIVPLEQKKRESSLFKEILRKLYVKEARDYIRYRKYRRFIAPTRDGMKIIFLHAGCSSMDALIRRNTAGKGDNYLKQKDNIRHINGFFCPSEKLLNYLDTSEDSDTKGGALEAFKCFINGERELLPDINRLCGFDTTSILAPYFKDFFFNIIPGNIREMRAGERFIEQKGIDYVVSRASSESETIGLLCAAYKKGISVSLQHASGAYWGPREKVIDTMLFNRFFAMHTEAADYLKSGNEGGLSCLINEDSTHLSQIQSKARTLGKENNNVILYVPTKLFLGFRSFNGYMYSITWYYRLQIGLLAYFAQQKEFTFIYKFPPGQDWAYETIGKHIASLNASNIKAANKPLTSYLGKASRVILDYPSTGLYETAVAGLPLLCICHQMMNIRADAMLTFGKSLQPFSNTHEAIDRIKEFIFANPEEYRVKVPFSNPDTYNILGRIKRGENVADDAQAFINNGNGAK